MKRGLYRIRGAGCPNDVRVEDDGIEMPMEETLYRAHGYLPRIDDLPWQEDYVRSAASARDLSDAIARDEKAARERARQEFLARFRTR